MENSKDLISDWIDLLSLVISLIKEDTCRLEYILRVVGFKPGDKIYKSNLFLFDINTIIIRCAKEDYMRVCNRQIEIKESEKRLNVSGNDTLVQMLYTVLLETRAMIKALNQEGSEHARMLFVESIKNKKVVTDYSREDQKQYFNLIRAAARSKKEILDQDCIEKAFEYLHINERDSKKSTRICRLLFLLGI